MANRHQGRILAFQALYGWEMTGNDLERVFEFEWLRENPGEDTLLFARLLISGVIQNSDRIDEKIKKHLLKWDFNRISRVDLAIMRLSVFSLLFQKDIPARVVINEAIEIAKEFAADDSYKFINGVLDGIAKSVL